MQLSFPILKSLIENQEEAIQWHKRYFVIVLSVGAVIIVCTNIFNSASADLAKMLLNIGGGCVSSISAYPLIQINSRKERLRIYKMFRDNYNELSPEDFKKLEELVWDSVKKI